MGVSVVSVYESNSVLKIETAPVSHEAKAVCAPMVLVSRNQFLATVYSVV